MAKELGIDDLVFSKNDGKIQAGGFIIQNSLLEKGIPAITVQNNKNMSGGSVSSLFKDLAVPAGFLYLQQNMAQKFYHEKHPEMINNGIYDKLFKLAQDKPIKKYTKKNKKTKSKNTRKNKT